MSESATIDPREAPGPSAAQLPLVSSTSRSTEMTRRLNTLNVSAGGVISLLVVVSIWGHWRQVAIIGALQALLMGFNAWVNLVYLPRRGRSAELVRNSLNILLLLAVDLVAGWPLPVWLMLPFLALVFDQLDREVAIWTLVATCVVLDVAALLCGVAWIYPLSFTLLAAFCSEISRRRYAVICDMLGHSDAQRLELAAAYDMLRLSHVQVTTETAARLRLEIDLRQAQKLEAIGRLAAGVAHEINTPVQCVSNSIHFLREANADLLTIVEKLQVVQRSVTQGTPSLQAAVEAAAAAEAADLPYLIDNIPKALERSLEGLDRVANIVRSMKEFSHPDSKEMTAVDLNRAIRSTLIIACTEYKYVAELETDLADLPRVVCHVGDFNQALLNIVVNAAHAIGDVVKNSEQKGLITVRTRQEGDQVVVSVADTGTGIPAAIHESIFDPFFTTKEVGKGTGQGLAIARSVAARHNGRLSFETAPGKGTTFFLRLPIQGDQQGAQVAPALASAA